MILYTAEELNHVLDKWIKDGVVKPFTVSRPPRKKERTLYFTGSTIMSSIPPRIVGPSEDFSTKN